MKKQIFETFLKVVRLNGIIEDSRVQAEALEKRIKSEIDTNSELKCQFHEIEAQLHGEKIKRENIESEMKNVHEIRKIRKGRTQTLFRVLRVVITVYTKSRNKV